MENNNKSSNNFFSGFLLGALLGAAIALLFVTKKGKKIFKAISEEGEGKISDILNKIEKSVDLEEVESADEEIEAVTPKREIAKKVVVEAKPATPRGEPKTGRRFFRGISRHVN